MRGGKPRPLGGPDDPRHGTLNGYTRHGCKCTACLAANAAYHRAYRAARRRAAAAEPTAEAS